MSPLDPDAVGSPDVDKTTPSTDPNLVVGATVVQNATSSASPLPATAFLLPPAAPNSGAVIAGIILFLVIVVASAACLWVIKRKKSRRRRRQYMASARKVTLAQEALDLDKPRSGSDDKAEVDDNDDDVILQNVNQVFESPPLQLKESSIDVSFGDRVLNSVAHLFGSKVPLGASRVRTSTGGADAGSVAASSGDAASATEEGAAPIVINGRIQALYDEIMRQDPQKPGEYGVLQEEVTPEAARRRPARKTSSFRPASELSTVSEVSMELMDREISTQLLDSGTMAGANAAGFDQSHLDLILQNKSRSDGDDNSLGLIVIDDELGGSGGPGGSGLGGGGSGLGGSGGELADELETSLPTSAAVGAGGTEISSTGFITDQTNPNKYYSIAYTEYFMDD